MIVEPSPSQPRGLGRLFDGSTSVASTERQLLDRFIRDRDELAFEAIVARHGAMVLGVCRAYLANPTDVDDAFQATFLVLVRKAESPGGEGSLGPWLHGVARRVALRARARSARGRGREVLGLALDPPAPDHPVWIAEQRELAATLHAEIDRLSRAERSAITLCDLEGLTHQEAADQLGWPLGTVKSRLTRGRDRLRGRLLRRGVALSASSFAATLAGESVASAVVARSLVVVTTRAALAVAAGRTVAVGLVSTSVLSLTPGVTRAMIFSKLQAGAVALAVAASVVVVPSLIAYQGQSNPTPAPGKSAVVAPVPVPVRAAPVSIATGPTDAPAVPLDPNQIKSQFARVAIQWMDIHPNQTEFEDKLKWHLALAKAEYAAARSKEDRVKAVRSYVDRLAQFVPGEVQDFEAALRQANYMADLRNLGLDVKLSQVDAMFARLSEAKQWLAAVETNPQGVAKPVGPDEITKSATNPPIPAQPSPGGGGGFDGKFGADDPQPGIRTPLPTLPADEQRQQAILAKLEERIDMPFVNDTPLGDVIQYVRQSTQDNAAGLSTGIPIYVDPQGLQDADKTMASTIAISLEKVPLRTTLRLLLRQLGLTYSVEEGLLMIVALDEEEDADRLAGLRRAVPSRPRDAARDQAIRNQLEERISMPFPNDTPLDDVKKYIEQSTQDDAAGIPKGIPVYVDPAGLQAADKTMAATIAINLEGIPLRTTLRLLLDQINLTYSVDAGLLLIGAKEKPLPVLLKPGNRSALPPTNPPTNGGGFR